MNNKITKKQKDEMWDAMDAHLDYLNGTSDVGTSYASSIYYLTEMLNGWNYIGERDVSKYERVLSNTFRLDKETQQLINKTAIAYLASTDWYITRNAETGELVPTDVLEKRAEARQSVLNT